ncbi:DEAD/DEAH box helicase [Paenibacillus aquistagni]|uniref:DEAD/DEAH box helicase n=1 Tax=Paenibacillus aquistagni TaxID=1852522 RepID=UPI000B5003B4|nr:DEAD/DEAH box helicase [Paenibacillus aquistagni]
MNISELYTFYFPEDIVEIWKNAGFHELLPIQKEAIEKGLFKGQNLLVVAPTSSGKTFIGEMAAIQYSYINKKSIYLVPFKAVADEKYEEFKDKYNNLGINIRISDGDHREDDEDIRVGNYHIAVMTYEKLSGMLIANPSLLNNCDCVIVDEVQMMSDPQRGGNLELLLTKMKESYKKTQIIALSAVLDSLNGFDKWLEAEVIKVNQRPVELRQGVLFTNGKFEYKEWNTSLIGDEQINATNLYDLIQYLLDSKEQIVIIKNSVPSTQELARELSHHFSSLPAASKVIGHLREEPETEIRDELLVTLRSSIAFHNADCDINERRLVESGFREGHIKILVSTTTLSMGVNLPCKTVILADHQKWDATGGAPVKVNWSVGEVRNIFGRAGRFGKANDFGRGIFLARNSVEREFIKRTYLNAPLEDFASALEDRDISLRVLDVVASGYGNNENNIADFIFKSYAALTWDNDNARQHILNHIKRGIDTCLTYGLFELSNQGKITITELGKVCASMGCSIDSFSLLVEHIQSKTQLNDLELIFLLSRTEEVNEKFYRIRWDNIDLKQKIQNRLVVEHADGIMTGLYLSEYEKFELMGRPLTKSLCTSFSMVLLVKDILYSENDLSAIRKAFGFSTASIRNVTLNISWMLDVIYQISNVIKPQFTNEIERLNKCIASRATLRSYFLNTLSKYLTREEKIRILNSGIVSLDDFVEKDSSEFQGIINPTKVDKIIEFINDKRDRNSQFWEKDHIRRIEKLALDSSLIKNIYSELGLQFEYRLCELFNVNFIDCTVDRIAEQSKGEPDLLMCLNTGHKYTIQVTAKEDKNKYIDSKKAGDVIPQSARLDPDGYICIGRPDFQELAIDQASHLGKKHNFKLVPLYALVELYVRVEEGELSSNDVTKFIVESKGYLNISAIDKFFKYNQ